MLDERQLKVCELLSVGTTITEVAKQLGVTRQTIYDWKKTESMKAKLDELGQDFLFSTKQSVISYGAKAVSMLKHLAEHAESEKVRLDAVSKLLDKVMSNATKIELDDLRDSKDAVALDVLTEELNDIDAE